MASTADVDEILKQLAAAQQADLAAAGLRKAHPTPPNSLAPGDLPALVNLPGPMTLTPNGSDEAGDEDLEERQYDSLLIVTPRAAGYPGEGFAAVLPWFATMAKFFSSRQALGAANALRVTLRGDSGITQPIQYAGQEYYGIRFQISITGLRRSTYADHE